MLNKQNMLIKLGFNIFVFSWCVIAAFGDLPPDIQKCKSENNNDCIAKSIMKVIELYPHGNKDIGLPDISAIALEEIVLAENKNDSPMQLSFKLKKLIVSGLEKLQVLRIKGFNKNITNTVELDFLIPKIRLDGEYEMKGQILLFPLNGKGKGKIDFMDAVLKFKVKISLEKRNNNIYGMINKFKLWDLETKRMSFNLENIMNNNLILSESINGVINENWRDFWKEFKQNIVKSSENVVKNIIIGILKVLPIDDFYSD